MQPVQTFSADLFLRMLVSINSNFFWRTGSVLVQLRTSNLMQFGIISNSY